MRSSRLSWRSVPAGLATVLILGGVLAAGCAAGSTASPAAVAPAVTNAWIRVPAGPDQPAAAYLTIANAGSQPDVLTSVSSPSAATCELHETTMDTAGMAGMHMIDKLEIPAGESVRLEPGGYHLMMTGVGAMTVGSMVELNLMFQRAGAVKVMAEVRAG
jgi:copper(I)-binding protein